MFGSSARRRREDGAAAVEFAIIVPLLVFLLFAIISYGFMLSFRQALSQAAAEGARAAAVTPPGVVADPDDLDDARRTRAREAVNQGLGSYGVSCDSSEKLIRGGAIAGSCAISDATSCSGSTTGATCVEVELIYNYSSKPLIPKFPGLGIVLPSALSYSTQAQVS